jgi:hypothetical protein
MEKIIEEANENAKKTETELKSLGKQLIVNNKNKRKWWIALGCILMIILVVVLIITLRNN